ncbi:restriction endonuclease subunit S [Aeromonas hydrophila]|uniref:restriction endonuclease subunit S n=1 Tax=Aeromonas hydrophila TaxID=644 RepID=UPI000760983E|nr:restriction endonuclease subunit S [Aeromonas hydrophila]KWR68780.1 hypothetical protein ATO50_06295 [Aeromonas hydrophila]HAU4927615.1 hypothetical protein [Aeromonas hydrophila]
MIAAEPKTTGQYQPYPQYKDSGVEWYKNIPTGWNIERFKFAVRKLESGTSVNAVDTPAEASQIGVLKTSAVYTGVFRHSENKAVVESDLTRVSCPVKKGCLIVSRMNTPDLVGAAGLVAETVDNLYLPDRLWQVHIVEKHAKFSHYWTLTPEYRNQVRLVCSGTSSSMQNLSQEQFLNFLVPSPSDDEKNSIAAFLDYETARIDRLVAQQQRLIELLKEKRQAVISHAVTKGLNPNAPMKDSGVEWLGQVPEHWIVRRLKHTATIHSGIPKGKDLADKKTITVPMLRVANVQDGYFSLDSVHEIEIEPHELARYSLKIGDVLMNEGGDNDKLGRGAVWSGQITPCIHQNHVFAIRVYNIEPEWLSWLTSSSYAKFYFYSVAKQSTNLASISSSNVKETPLVIPPKMERAEIMRYLDEKVAKFARLESQATLQIELLQERRTALISAAVTGKIDLRGWTPPAGEVAA